MRALHARKNAGPAIATVPVASGDRPAWEPPIGASQFWGATVGGAAAGTQPGHQLPPYPDCDTLHPLFKYLPFRWGPAGPPAPASRGSRMAPQMWQGQAANPAVCLLPAPHASCKGRLPAGFCLLHAASGAAGGPRRSSSGCARAFCSWCRQAGRLAVRAGAALSALCSSGALSTMLGLCALGCAVRCYHPRSSSALPAAAAATPGAQRCAPAARFAPVPPLQEVQLHEVMQEMQQRLESGGAVSLADLEASKQRIGGLALDSPGRHAASPRCLSCAACAAGCGAQVVYVSPCRVLSCCPPARVAHPEPSRAACARRAARCRL